LVEALDVTRTRLLHASRTDAPCMVLVTSAVPAEGKTTLSCHLATSLARSGRRTLLLDADMRWPAVHTMFQLGEDPGFAELLQSRASAEDVLRPSPFPDLWIMTAGRWTPAAARALALPRLAAVLNDLKQRFDFVLVDSPPVLPVADSLLLSSRVDGVLFSALQGVSRVHPLRQAAGRLNEVGARMLGVVLNGVRVPRYGYSYGYAHEPAPRLPRSPRPAQRKRP
jgi:capsular exopolysaccharide synthesis family protein